MSSTAHQWKPSNLGVARGHYVGLGRGHAGGFDAARDRQTPLRNASLATRNAHRCRSAGAHALATLTSTRCAQVGMIHRPAWR